MVTARVRSERRSATGCLTPTIISPGVVSSEPGTTMLVHDAVRGNGGGRERDECEYECEYESGFHCGGYGLSDGKVAAVGGPPSLA
jgi:hypothetical protein